MFGHAQMMTLKVTWDYAYYWGIMCQFFFQRRLTDVALFARLAEPLAACETLNRDMQLLLRTAAGVDVGDCSARMIDQGDLDWFVELNRGLRDKLDEAQLEQRVRDHAAMLHALAAEIRERIREMGCSVPADLGSLADLRMPSSNLLLAAA